MTVYELVVSWNANAVALIDLRIPHDGDEGELERVIFLARELTEYQSQIRDQLQQSGYALVDGGWRHIGVTERGS